MKLPQPPPTMASLFSKIPQAKVIELLSVRDTEVAGEYLHWDELRHRTPPPSLTPETWWLQLELARDATRLPLPLQGQRPFTVGNPDCVRRLVYTVDRDASGRIEVPEPVVSPAIRDRYVVAGLIEEAITSSQLEGASTTRQVAKDMLRSGRPPRDHDERMIVNNYEAMQWIGQHRSQPPSPDALLELHRILVKDTLDISDGAGRLRRADEAIHVVDPADGEVLHVPPPAGELEERMAAMCRFATDEHTGGFIHPVVRAVLLHFWLAYDHPFVDGNGRTARALFYWQMLRAGYWLTEFISISRILRKAPAKYARAFLHAETTFDTTYFVVHQLRVFRQALEDVFAYVRRKTEEARALEAQLRGDANVNHRQVALLARMLREPEGLYTIEGHQRSHRVVYQTARRDLLELVDRGWLAQRKAGRAFVFSPVKDLERKIAGSRRRG